MAGRGNYGKNKGKIYVTKKRIKILKEFINKNKDNLSEEFQGTPIANDTEYLAELFKLHGKKAKLLGENLVDYFEDKLINRTTRNISIKLRESYEKYRTRYDDGTAQFGLEFDPRTQSTTDFIELWKEVDEEGAENYFKQIREDYARLKQLGYSSKEASRWIAHNYYGSP